MINLIKNFVKDVWAYIWSKTTVDEKEVGNQIGDIDDAIAGKSRKGRKSGKTK